MSKLANRTHNSAKIKAVQEAPQAETDLDVKVAEHEKNPFVLKATERFVRSGIRIKDVYGNLGR
jgi:hypothetical protein